MPRFGFLAMIPATSSRLFYKKDLADEISVCFGTRWLTASTSKKRYNVTANDEKLRSY